MQDEDERFSIDAMLLNDVIFGVVQGSLMSLGETIP